MTEKGLLIVFSGPSGVGKDTLLREFLRTSPDCVRSVSVTTRAPREGEVHGQDYFFVSREEFGGYAARGELLEYAEYGGNYYGTPGAAVEEQRAHGRHVILKIDVQGALKVRELVGDAVFIFVMPPSWQTLRTRLENRNTEHPDAVRHRLDIAQNEIAMADRYDYVVVNDSLEHCLLQLSAILTAESCKTANRMNFIREVLGNA